MVVPPWNFQTRNRPSKPQHSKDAKKFSSPYQTSKDAEQPAQTEFIFFDFTIKMSRWEEPAEHRPDLDLYLQPYRDNIDQAMAAKDWDVALRNIDIVLPMLVLNDQRPHCRAGAFTPTELVETIGQHGLPDQLLLVFVEIFTIALGQGKGPFPHWRTRRRR